MKTLILIIAAFVLSSIAYSEVENCWCVPHINPNYSWEDSVVFNTTPILYFDTCGTYYSTKHRSCDSIFWFSYNHSPEGKENLYARGVWNITFEEKVIDIPAFPEDTLIFLHWQDIDTSFHVIRKHFREISEWYGSYYLLKQHNFTSEPLIGQEYIMAFDSINVNIHAVNTKLDSIHYYYVDSLEKTILINSFVYYPEGSASYVKPKEAETDFELIQGNNFITLRQQKGTTISGVKIYNIHGEILYEQSKSFKHEVQIDISSYPSGLYFIQVGNYFDKFMVIR